MPLYLPRKVAAQPQGRARVDFANPLTKHMTFAWTASNGFQESVNGDVKNYAVNGDLVVNGVRSSKGIVQNTSVNGSIFWGLRERTVNTIGNQFTIGVAFQVQDLSVDNTSIINVTNAGFYANVIGVVSSRVQASTTNANTTVVSNNTVSVGDWIYAVYVLQNGNFQLYVNGVKQTAVGTGTLPTSSLPYNYIDFGPSRANLLTAFIATRPWSQAEVTSWTNNPWQIFAPSAVTVLGSAITYTYSRPSSDVTTQWTPSTPGADHYTMINETTYNDANYIAATAAAQTDEVGLQAMTAPQAGSSVLVNYRVQGITGGGSVTVSLYSGATLVKTDTTRTANNTSPAYYTMTVTSAEWGAVAVNWSNMRLRFVSA
jgi:hypothetical protein